MSTREVSEEELARAIQVGTSAMSQGGYYLHVRVIADGRVVHAMPWRMGGVQVSVGNGDGFYSDTWVYDCEQHDDGWRAAVGWDGKGEPEGWCRHVQSGRRRPGGDPSKEFVRA
jgi:hypothetical protein